MKIQSKSLAGKKKTRTNIRTYRELRERFDSFQTLQFVFGNRQPLQIRAQLQTLTDTIPHSNEHQKTPFYVEWNKHRKERR